MFDPLSALWSEPLGAQSARPGSASTSVGCPAVCVATGSLPHGGPAPQLVLELECHS